MTSLEEGAAAPPPASAQPGRWPWYLIVHNVAKRANLGQMMRSACAFGVSEVLVVGTRRKDMRFFGAQGTQHHVQMRTFPKLAQAAAYARERGCSVCGVEIRADAKAVGAPDAFAGPTAFLMGNEGHGLSEAQVAQCDSFVYIPQFGSGTASLNVTVAASIVFHRFTERAGYSERARHEEKYVVAELSGMKWTNVTRHDASEEAEEVVAPETSMGAMAGLFVSGEGEE